MAAMHMKIDQGTLKPHSLRPVGKGFTGAHHAIVSVNGVSFRCIAKPGKHAEIAAECFSALLGDYLQLPTLPPIVCTNPVDNQLWIASKDISHPSLATRFSISYKDNRAEDVLALAQILAGWSQLGSAIAFDEMIFNGDRNFGNLMWDGANFWLIDHAGSLGVQPMNSNLLASFAIENFDLKLLESTSRTATASSLTFVSMAESSTIIWKKTAEEFAALVDSISGHHDKFMELVQSQLPSLASRTATALAPLFAK